MKKNLFLLIMLLFISFLLLNMNCTSNASSGGGGSNEDGTTFATTPEADPADDNSNEGVYKGTIIGSTGNFKICINNGSSNVIQLIINYTDNSGTTSGTIIGTETDNGNGTFTYNFNQAIGTYNIIFSVTISETGIIDFNNSTFQINATIILTELIKELSTSLVRIYEGQSYNNKNPQELVSTWNCVTNGNDINCIWKHISGGYSGTSVGNITGNNITGTYIDTVNPLTGTFQGNIIHNYSEISGTWAHDTINDPEEDTGTLSGYRTL